jgi:prophage regulatory protein
MTKSVKPEPRTLLRKGQVLQRVGFRTNKLYDLIAEGLFPRPAKIGRISVWPADEVDQWVADRIAERDAETPKKTPNARPAAHAVEARV